MIYLNFPIESERIALTDYGALMTITYKRHVDNENELIVCSNNKIIFSLDEPDGAASVCRTLPDEYNQEKSQPRKEGHKQRDPLNKYKRRASNTESMLSSISSEYRSEASEPIIERLDLEFEQKPIFVHSQGPVAHPASQMSDLYSCKLSNRVLSLISTCSRIVRTAYTHTWPNIMRGNSLILVDSSDKSMAYQPAICKMIRLRLRMQQNTDEDIHGPQAIIICETDDDVTATATACMNFFNVTDQRFSKKVIIGLTTNRDKFKNTTIAVIQIDSIV